MTEHALADYLEQLAGAERRTHEAWEALDFDRTDEEVMPPMWRDYCSAKDAFDQTIRVNLPAILAALRRPASPHAAVEDVAAAAIRVADATLCQWAPPVDCGLGGQPCLCEEAAKAVLRRPEPAAGDVEAVLPYDVRVGNGTFGKGVKLSTFIEAARRWHKAAYEEHPLAVAAADNIQAALAALLRPEADEGAVQ